MSRQPARLAGPAWSATVPRQILWFVLIGTLSTVLQSAVYVPARMLVPASFASWMALLVVTPLNTEANRRLTFAGVTTDSVPRLHWEAGLTSVAVFVANLFLAPELVRLAGTHPSALTESLMLAATGSMIGGLRYIMLRGWVFALHRHHPAHAH